MTYDFDTIVDRRNSNAIKWKAYDEDVLPFWVADMDFRAPEPVIRALHAAVEHGVFGYEMMPKRLGETVVARMRRLYNWDMSAEMVIATTGIVSAFNAAAQALCAPGEGYLIQPPVYMPFNYLQPNYGFIRQEAPLARLEGEEVRYGIDWDVFEKAFNTGGSKTKMLLLCNPHNPSGQIYSPNELARMAETCLKNDTVIVSDEIHSELLLGGAPFTPMAALSPEIACRTITLIAPSKTFNIAGLFCGFAIIPDPELRERFKKVVERMTLHVSSLGFVAAEAALSGECDSWLDALRAYLTTNRDFISDFAAERLPDIRVSNPDATYLGWFDCSALKLESPYKFFLENAKVALNDGVAFGTGGEGFVRFNFGTPRELIVEGLERMAKAIR